MYLNVFFIQQQKIPNNVQFKVWKNLWGGEAETFQHKTKKLKMPFSVYLFSLLIHLFIVFSISNDEDNMWSIKCQRRLKNISWNLVIN